MIKAAAASAKKSPVTAQSASQNSSSGRKRFYGAELRAGTISTSLVLSNGPRLRKNPMRTCDACIGKIYSLLYSPSQMYILRSGGWTDTDKIISRTIWQGNDDFLQRIQEKGTVNNEGYINIGTHLGLTSQRGKCTPYPSFLPPVSHSFTFARI